MILQAFPSEPLIGATSFDSAGKDQLARIRVPGWLVYFAYEGIIARQLPHLGNYVHKWWGVNYGKQELRFLVSV
jgi:hypothetical protein